MTVLEKGKFVKNFVRVRNEKDKLVKVKHSNRLGYSKADIEQLEDKIDQEYWSAWEKYLRDKKSDENLIKQYTDYNHFLFGLNSISEADIKLYTLPETYVIIDL